MSEESKRTYRLEQIKKFIIDKLKNDYRTNRYKKLSYSYETTIINVVNDSYNRELFTLNCTIRLIDCYSACITLYGGVANIEFSFDGRVWIRERKLKDLL